MDDAAGVGVGEGGGDLPRDAHRFVDRQPSLPSEPIAQGLALDVRHDIIEEPVGLPGVVQRQDVRMRHRRGDLDLAQEALGANRRTDLGPQDFNRYSAAVLAIFCEKDRAHPATA